MQKIIAGRWRGRPLEYFSGREIRPTSSRARESVFNILMHRYTENGDSYIIGQNIADICCGSGAMGLEALSRGAEHATFVDTNNDSLKLARRNAHKLNALDECDFVLSDAVKLPTSRKSHQVVFIDPPYGKNLLPAILESLEQRNWVAAGGLIVAEQSAADPLPETDTFALIEDRKYGRSRVLIYS